MNRTTTSSPPALGFVAAILFLAAALFALQMPAPALVLLVSAVVTTLALVASGRRDAAGRGR